MSTTRKTVLITGCSSGIGAALADGFCKSGYHVFATARTPSKISPSLTSSPNVTVLSLDVLSAESIAAAVASVSKETGGKLDILINNAGSNLIMPILDLSIDEAKKLFDVNFWAPVAVVQAFGPLLIKAKGCIVNNTSVNGEIPAPFMSAYNASKAALVMCSETMRLEFGPFGVRTITLLTGGVKTYNSANFTPAKLPADSLFEGGREYIENLGDGKLQAKGMAPSQYAAQVVRVVEKGASGKCWVGGQAGLAKLGAWLFPQSMMDKLLHDMYPGIALVANGTKYKEL